MGEVFNIMNKLSLTEEEYEILTKGIAGGVGIGTIVGCFTSNVEFFFALGGIIGIIISSAYSFYIRYKCK